MEEMICVSWRPHCSSCQKVKEFLKSRGVAFASINVEASPAALKKLRALGARGVPVVVRGDAFVYAQSVDDVARFVGAAPPEAARLSVDQLVRRMDAILAGAAMLVRRIPIAMLDQHLPERLRTYRDLSHHIFRIAEVFIECAPGARAFSGTAYGRAAGSPGAGRARRDRRVWRCCQRRVRALVARGFAQCVAAQPEHLLRRAPVCRSSRARGVALGPSRSPAARASGARGHRGAAGFS